MPVTVATSELRAVLRLVARGLVGPPRPDRNAAADAFGLLSEREMEVFELLVRPGESAPQAQLRWAYGGRNLPDHDLRLNR